jgi:hypothetical protein
MDGKMTIQPPNLRPLKVGEILDRAFRLYRANFRLFIGIVSVLLVPFLVLELLSLFIFHETRLVSSIRSFLTGYLLDGAMIWVTSHSYLGHPTSMKDSYRQARRCFRPFFGASFLQVLAYLPAGILFALGTVGGALGIVIMALFVAPYIIFLSTRWGLSFPAIMLENMNGTNGLTRSWSLTSKDFWRVCVVLTASSVLSYMAISLPAIMIVYAMQLFDALSMIGPALSSVLTQLGAIMSLPLTMSILVILYYDLRVRREAFDLELALQTPLVETNISNEQI